MNDFEQKIRENIKNEENDDNSQTDYEPSSFREIIEAIYCVVFLVIAIIVKGAAKAHYRLIFISNVFFFMTAIVLWCKSIGFILFSITGKDVIHLNRYGMHFKETTTRYRFIIFMRGILFIAFGIAVLKSEYIIDLFTNGLVNKFAGF